MTKAKAAAHTHAMLGGKAGPTPWNVVRKRLAKPAEGQTSWLSTVRPDGRPHLMPLIAFWIEDAFYFVAGEGTRKARNLADDEHCVIATSSTKTSRTKLPSIDVVVEGRAAALTDPAEVMRIAKRFVAKKWQLKVRGAKVYGPNAPTAGPAPYSIFRMVPVRAFGLPGMLGMEQFRPEELPKPTRWDFDPEG